MSGGHGVGSIIVFTSFVIMHVLDSPKEMLPLRSGDTLDVILTPVGGIGVLSITEYSSSTKISVIPTEEPWNKLGEGWFPSAWIVKADGVSSLI